MTGHVVITGGNKGLGLAQTRAFLAAGWNVTVLARSRGEIDQMGETFVDRLQFLEADIANADADALLAEVIALAGMPTALINNAGRHLKKPVWDVTPDEFDAVLDINLKAMFALCGAFVRLRKEAGGAIVNISSMAGLMALPSAAAYVTSKTAVVGLTRSIAIDAAAYGIRCNAVCPGFIETDMTRAVLEKDPARKAKIVGRIPGGAFGSADDVAEACLFLADDSRARYINGVALPVDGGFSVGF